MAQSLVLAAVTVLPLMTAPLNVPPNSPAPESAPANPGADAVTVLLLMTTPLAVMSPSAWRPPEKAVA